MKKLFLTLIVSLALCGSAFAQSHWPDFDNYNNTYEDQGGLVAAIIIDGEAITVEYEGWDALEISAWVGNDCRANNIYLNNEFVLEFGDPYPVTWGDAIFYTTPGETLTFKMYDHSRNIEYNTFVTALQYGEPLTLVTGDDHFEGWDNPDDVISLSFTSPEPETSTFTKPIVGYGNDDADSDHWYLISSPIGNVAPGDVQGLIQEVVEGVSNYDLYWFNQATTDNNEWRNHKVDTIEYLEAGHGYLYASKQNDTLIFTGQAYDGNGNFALAYADGKDMGGWNLMGNPFPFEATVSQAYYVMNENGSEIEPATGDYTLQPMEGCFIQATAAGQNVTFTAAEQGGEKSELVLNLTQGRAVVDRAIVSFGESRQLSKLQLNPDNTKVYIPQDGEDYAMVSAGEMGEMPVNFKAKENGSFNMNFTATAVSFNYLHLIDNMTGADVDLLATPSYSFDALTTDYASRFRLVFATGNAEGENFGFFSDGNFIISNEGEANVQVVDVTGRILRNETINGSGSISLSGAAGVYMIRLINGENVRVQKVVVR